MSRSARSLSFHLSLFVVVVTAASVGCGIEPLTFESGELFGHPSPPGLDEMPNRWAPESLEPCEAGESWPTRDPLQIRHVSGPRAGALRITFVSEGFLAEDEDIYWEHLAWLMDQATRDERGVAGQLAEHLRVDGVFVPSASRDVFNGDRNDTVFGACLRESQFGSTPKMGSLQSRRDFVASQLPERPHVLVVLMNAGDGRANAQSAKGKSDPHVRDDGTYDLGLQVATRTIHLHRADAASVLDHELAHSLLHLGDEYSQSESCFEEASARSTTRPPLYRTPNLTVDASGAKWAGLVEGAFEGGSQRGKCIYHPTESCRMLGSESDHYCPVCQGEIVALRAALDLDQQDGAPACDLTLYGTKRDGLLTSAQLMLEAHDDNLPLSVSIFQSGVLLAEGRTEDARWVDVFSFQIAAQAEEVAVQAFCTDGLGRRTEVNLKLTAGELPE